MSKNSVLIKGRTALHADSGDILNTVDVCLTRIGNSVVPIPYPNVAESKDADNAASTVFINGQPACTKDSTFRKSRGDEPGNKKGVKSGTKGGEASFIMGSSNVFIEGVPAARAMDMMVSNNQNTPPMPLVQEMGLPPMPGDIQAPEEMEAAQGPDGIEVLIDGTPPPSRHSLRSRAEDSLTEVNTPISNDMGEEN